jgi:hypothetical protein
MGRLVCLLLGLLAWAAASVAAAQNLESVLRPGELIRGHAKWDDDCGQCHVRFDRAAQNERCMDCHKPIGADMRARTGMHGRLKPQSCRACHTDHKGRDARIAEFDTRRFDHAATDYALRGKHAETECARCHAAGRKYSQAPLECNACHRKDDTHKGSLGARCADCHGETDWKRTTFDHDKTRFPLLGKHVDAPCADCHKDNRWKDTPRACVSCHRKDDDAAKGHRGRYGERCDSCHDAKAWKPSTFVHDRDTRWVLRGKHRGAACADCHVGALYRDKTGSACIDCHRRDDRHEGALGRECQACHGERDWKETQRFDHDRSSFALLGKHRDARCEACHDKGRYKLDDTSCAACHRKDDLHKPSLGERCESCHSERDWRETSRFDHRRSRFSLLGRHADTRCADCHVGPTRPVDYRAAATDCNACHRKDDKHETNLGPRCADCHDERAWKPAPKFDHQRTRFALRNAHALRDVRCQDCHADIRRWRDTPRDCLSCHRKDDRHEGQLGADCAACHDDVRWTRTRFDHARARFVLTGRHLPLECKACHKSARHRDAPRDCFGCHQADDKHKSTLGSACESCHNARGWRLWSYDHARRARWPLLGAHARAGCERCHAQPAPKGRATAAVGTRCQDCHQRDDVHDGAFGPQCDRCHGVEDWKRIERRADARGAAAGTGEPQAAWILGRSGVFGAARRGRAAS